MGGSSPDHSLNALKWKSNLPVYEESESDWSDHDCAEDKRTKASNSRSPTLQSPWSSRDSLISVPGQQPGPPDLAPVAIQENRPLEEVYEDDNQENHIRDLSMGATGLQNGQLSLEATELPVPVAYGTTLSKTTLESALEQPAHELELNGVDCYAGISTELSGHSEEHSATPVRSASIIRATTIWAEKNKFLRRQLQLNKEVNATDIGLVSETCGKGTNIRESTYDHQYEYVNIEDDNVADIQSHDSRLLGSSHCKGGNLDTVLEEDSVLSRQSSVTKGTTTDAVKSYAAPDHDNSEHVTKASVPESKVSASVEPTGDIGMDFSDMFNNVPLAPFDHEMHVSAHQQADQAKYITKTNESAGPQNLPLPAQDSPTNLDIVNIYCAELPSVPTPEETLHVVSPLHAPKQVDSWHSPTPDAYTNKVLPLMIKSKAPKGEAKPHVAQQTHVPSATKADAPKISSTPPEADDDLARMEDPRQSSDNLRTRTKTEVRLVDSNTAFQPAATVLEPRPNTTPASKDSDAAARVDQICKLSSIASRINGYQQLTEKLATSNGLALYLKAKAHYYAEISQEMPGSSMQLGSLKTAPSASYTATNLGQTTQRIADLGKGTARELIQKSGRGLKSLFHNAQTQSVRSTSIDRSTISLPVPLKDPSMA